MPTLTETIGGASANTYATLTQANDYALTTLHSDDWAAADEGKRQVALIVAQRILTGLNWLGRRVTDTQSLSWPRYDALKADAVSGGEYRDRETYLTTEIPQRIKDAQCELALALIRGVYNPDGGPAISSFTVDAMTTAYANPERANDLPRGVTDLIAPLLAGNRLRRG